MFLLRHAHFPAYSHEQFLAEPHTKTFQRPYLTAKVRELVSASDVVADIGAHQYFHFLEASGARVKAIIDPYTGASGAGLSEIPPLPYPIALFRCEIGKDSGIIPDAMFDATFSCSVIEHIGQAVTGNDCVPAATPHPKQEVERDAFCAELFRITKSGGITFHTVDHAARNIDFQRNFEKAGFKSVDFAGEPRATVEQALNASDAVRQRVNWRREHEPMPADEQSLHAVLFMMFRRP